MLRVSTSTVLCIAIVAGCCWAEEPKGDAAAPSSQEIDRLRTFAKMYGYVRFFHPSDEAASIDWDRFAILGAIRVREVGPMGDFPQAMNDLFMPIAPTVRIFPTGSEPEPVTPPENAEDLEPVAWQHLGVRLPGKPSIYKSKRTNREARFSAGGVFGTIIQSVDATPYRGRKVRLTSSIRTAVDGEGNQGQMWLRVDRASGGRGFFNNMGDRPVTSSEWGDYEIVGEIADDAEWIVFGCFLLGMGQVWVDDFRLEIGGGEGGWSPIELRNPGFEDGEVGEKPVGWSARTPGYLFEVTEQVAQGGERSVMITHQPDEVVTDDLFEARPAVGEVIDTELGVGLSARIPLVVWSEEAATIPAADEESLRWMRIELDSVNMRAVSEFSECTRLAGVVIAWNVLQHFYPYFDVVDVDWDAELTRALGRALADETGLDYFDTLNDMAVALSDGHAQVDHYRYRKNGFLPIALDWVENEVVVTASSDPGLDVGDVIGTIDGVESSVALREQEGRVSGSPQSKRSKAIVMLGAGEAGDTVALTVRRGGEEAGVEVVLVDPSTRPSESRPEMIEKLDDEIFYVDLTRASMPEITDRMTEIAAARGVIFDLRGYPNGNHQVISHLLTEPDTSTAWMRIPEIIYPDHVEPAGWDSQGWNMEPMEPHIGGKAVFITDGSAISYAESVMSLVDGYDLAEIVGQPTAGTNGNVNPMTLPGGFIFYWTGMKVVTHEGEQHHLIGVQPSVPVERTIEGIREGRDELLEKALEVIDRCGTGSSLKPAGDGGGRV
jgi:C-terminal processing protease CtpA/Prc